MFSYEEIKRLIRFKEKDINEIKYSDYEIRHAVNECIRYFNNSYALQNSDFLEKIVDFVEDDMNVTIGIGTATYSYRQDSAIMGKALLGYMVLGSVGSDSPNEPDIPSGGDGLHDFKCKGVELPEDFITLGAVMRLRDGYVMFPVDAISTPNDAQYKIVGGRIYSGNKAFKLLYKAAIAEVKDDSDEIHLPFVFKDAVAKISSLILNNAETDVLMKTVDDTVRAIVPRRRYRNVRSKMPFIV